MKYQKPSNLDSLVAYPFALLAMIILAWVLFGSSSEGAPVCRVQKQAVVQQSVAYPPVLYKIGQSVEQEAAATLQFRHSEEYIELQQLRGFKAGVDAVAAVSGDRPSSPSGLAMKGGDNPGGAEQPPAPQSAANDAADEIPPANPSPALDAFYERYPTLAQNCSRCHTGDNPKGDVFLDGSVPLAGPDAATKRDAIARAIVNGHMPPNRVLEAQEQFNALSELFTEPTD